MTEGDVKSGTKYSNSSEIHHHVHHHYTHNHTHIHHHNEPQVDINIFRNFEDGEENNIKPQILNGTV